MERNLTMDREIQTCLGLTSEIIKLSREHIWIDYDSEADVLYLSFRKPRRAKNTIEFADYILLRQDGNKLVGITILNAITK